MKRGAKIGLGIGCGLLLTGGLVLILGYFALNYVESRLGESTGPFEIEGREFGKKTDQQGCITEGMRRSKSIGLLDFSRAMELPAFRDSCLETSRPTPNFCDGVPSFWSMKESEWGAAQCRKAGINPETTGCVHVTKRKHQFCSKPF